MIFKIVLTDKMFYNSPSVASEEAILSAAASPSTFTLTTSGSVLLPVPAVALALAVALAVVLALAVPFVSALVVLLALSTLGGVGFGFFSSFSNSLATTLSCLGTSSERKTASSDGSMLFCSTSFSSSHFSATLSKPSTLAISVSLIHERFSGHSAIFDLTVAMVFLAVSTASGRFVLSTCLSKIG